MNKNINKNKKKFIERLYLQEIYDAIKAKFNNLELYLKKYTIEYYIKNIINFLTSCYSWTSLSKFLNDSLPEYHYKTIYNFFNKLSKNNIFEDAFKSFMEKYYYSLNKIKKTYIPLLIDSTIVFNKNGKESIDRFFAYRKKKASKISILVDAEDHVILSTHIASSPNQHDLNIVKQTIEQTSFTNSKLNIIGDKAYLTSKKIICRNNKINLIAPKRINQKIKNTQNEKKLLAKRYIVEKVINLLKSNVRACLRYDSSNRNFMSFLYLISLMKNSDIFFKYKT